jgi:hypothetical protein
MPTIPIADRYSAGLLGDGMDITGRQVEYWGDTWTITGKNYLGDWDLERFEMRTDGRFKITSSISSEILPEAHGHFARLVSHS